MFEKACLLRVSDNELEAHIKRLAERPEESQALEFFLLNNMHLLQAQPQSAQPAISSNDEFKHQQTSALSGQMQRAQTSNGKQEKETHQKEVAQDNQ